MTNEMDVNQTFKGKDGEIWLNETLLANCDEFEAKLAPEYEEIKLKGKTRRIAQGYAVSGTLKTIKIDSSFSNIYADQIKQGNTPLFTIIGKTTNGTVSERIKYEEVTFDDMTLQSIKQGESQKDEMSFQAVDFEYIDR